MSIQPVELFSIRPSTSIAQTDSTPVTSITDRISTSLAERYISTGNNEIAMTKSMESGTSPGALITFLEESGIRDKSIKTLSVLSKKAVSTIETLCKS